MPTDASPAKHCRPGTEILLRSLAALWRTDPVLRRLFWLPTLASLIAYIVVGVTGWIVGAPLLAAAMGEWEVVGKFLAIALWIALFPIVFLVFGSVAAEFVYDPLAARIETALGVVPTDRTAGIAGRIGQGIAISLLSLLAIAAGALVGAWLPWLAPLTVFLATGWGGMASGVAMAGSRRGIPLSTLLSKVLLRPRDGWWEAVLLCGTVSFLPLMAPVVLPLSVALGVVLCNRRAGELCTKTD